MHFGLFMFPTEDSIYPGELAQAAEDHGFESLLFPEHTHIPVSRRTPYPGGRELPDEYVRTFDPFVALTAAAMATRALRIGTGICLITQRDPIITAKEVATLDHLSSGRVLFGVGAGWNREELENHGTDPRTRIRLMQERIEAMKEIWTREVAAYEGELLRLEPLWMWPKPVQRPHPPILVGGNGPGVLRRVIDFGDEWLPRAGRSEGDLAARITELQQLAADHRREQVPVSLFAATPDERAVQGYIDAGVHRCLFHLPSAPSVEVLSKIAEYSRLVNEFGQT